MSVLLVGLEVAQRQARGRIVEPAGRGGAPWSCGRADEAVGVEVDALGLLDLAALEVDVDGPAAA